MIVRIIILFLIFILVMAMIQKVLRPGGRLGGRAGPRTIDRLRCPTCKRVNFSNTPAPCGRNDCRYR